MTVIVAVSDGKRTCLASDSQATSNGAKETLHAASSKLVRVGPMVFGCGALVVSEFLRHYWSIGDIGADADVLKFLATQLVPELREHLRKNGQLEKSPEGTEVARAHTLAAHRGDIFVLDMGGPVIRMAEPFSAIGSGCCEARGAMWALTRDADGEEYMPKGPANAAIAEYIARLGVEAAIALDSGCGPPCVVEWTEP